MVRDQYKDLKDGDCVTYKEYNMNGTLIESGEGKVIGFGFGEFDWIVWIVRKGNGEVKFIPYKDVKKAPTE